jgi:3-O-methylgallate 3,4-dioxygenase
MARIVLGIGSSHTPQLSTSPEWWEDHANRDRASEALLGRDGQFHTFDAIAAEQTWNIDPGQLTPQVWTALHDRSQNAVEMLRQALEEANPDIVLVIGDDQEEMFQADSTPTFAVYWGETIDDFAPDDEEQEAMAAGLRAALWAVHSEELEKYPVPAQFGRHLIEQLVTDEFDVMQVSAQPKDRALGHAFTFVRRRLMGKKVIPLLPVLINTYYGPNQPSPRRCYHFGRTIRRAIETYPEDVKVAVVASGGLSHFVVDEELDRLVLDGLKARDFESLSTIPRRYMRSGTSEALNWIAAGAAMESLKMEVVDYIPAYRSTAGTGVGMAFALWR